MVHRKCPRCGSLQFRKVRRKRWMRYVPFSCCWECRECYSKFLLVLGIVVWRHSFT